MQGVGFMPDSPLEAASLSANSQFSPAALNKMAISRWVNLRALPVRCRGGALSRASLHQRARNPEWRCGRGAGSGFSFHSPLDLRAADANVLELPVAHCL